MRAPTRLALAAAFVVALVEAAACEAGGAPTAPSRPAAVTPRGSAPCSPWQQDCAAGEKCSPYARGEQWDAHRCWPVPGGAAGIGDPCTYADRPQAGGDTCGRGAVCWAPDSDGPRRCVAQCQGYAGSPVCVDPRTTCVTDDAGVVAVCLPHCDPLDSACPRGSACAPRRGAFVCEVLADGAPTAGEPCDDASCAPGLLCIDAARVEACPSASCCAPACDARADDCASGRTCEPWYADDDAPPDLEHIGVCVVPR